MTPNAAITIDHRANTAQHPSVVNVLARKEWRENRMIVLGMVLLTGLTFLIPTIWVELARHQHSATDRMDGLPIDADGFVSVVLILWALTAIVCGSSIVAPEVGSGSLQLLDALPISRKRIWWIKIGSGLAIMLCTFLAIAVTMALLCAVGVPLTLITFTIADRWQGNSVGDTVAAILLLTVAALSLFAAGSVATMMIDRVVPAIIAAFLVGIVVNTVITVLVIYIPLGFGYQVMQTYTGAYVIGLALLAAALLQLRVSYHLFTAGETLKTRKRFDILGSYLMPPLFLIGALVLAFVILVAWT